MDGGSCEVLYVDSRVLNDGLHQHNESGGLSAVNDSTPRWESASFGHNVRLLAEAFGPVHLCTTGNAALAKLFTLHYDNIPTLTPTIVLVDIPPTRPNRTTASEDVRTPAADAPNTAVPGIDQDDVICDSSNDIYGLVLLRRIVGEAHFKDLSPLVVPIAVCGEDVTEVVDEVEGVAVTVVDPDSLVRECLDAGAVDVVVGKFDVSTVRSLRVRAYGAYKDAMREKRAVAESRRSRKRSWVGFNEEKPYAYLRESMVEGLMQSICRLQEELDDDLLHMENIRIAVSVERQAVVAEAIGHWNFDAHHFSEDELVVAAMLMFKHAFTMPECEPWRLSTGQLRNFLLACRNAYNNSFVPFHNFRHVVDVLQASFSFLTQLGVLPPYRLAEQPSPRSARKSPMASLLSPFDAITLLIAAIGHDVGHPGVNNQFLVRLNAPLAQLYNDRSVLETFHCAAYNQILRRFWPSAFEHKDMRNLMISSILATDMGLHNDYIQKLSALQERLAVRNSVDGWNGKMIAEQKALLCALLIKCADISNVARRHDIAFKWTNVLVDEFARQKMMEDQLGVETSLMSPPDKELVAMSRGQLSFMNVMALPLFQGVASIMPEMQYTMDELEDNKREFENKVAAGSRGRRSEGDAAPVSPLTTNPDGGSAHAGDSPDSAATVARGLAPSPQITPGSNIHPKDCSPPLQSPPVDEVSKPAHIPNMATEYQEVNAHVSSLFEGFGDSQFGTTMGSGNGSSSGNPHPGQGSRAQRSSETTDGSSSTPFHGDWASQATSATTGKMPLSPSTQGTSVISRDSSERPSSVPVTNVTAPDTSSSTDGGAHLAHLQSYAVHQQHQNNGTSHSQHNGFHGQRPHHRRGVVESVSVDDLNDRLQKNYVPQLVVDGPEALNGNGTQKQVKKRTSRLFFAHHWPFFRRYKPSPNPASTQTLNTFAPSSHQHLAQQHQPPAAQY